MIKLEKISKAYGGKNVLSDFSLTVNDGERVALFGASGSGKTTCLRIIEGLEKADSGNVFCDNGISVVFQEDRLFEDFTLLQNVTAVCGDENKAKGILLKVGLEDFGKKPRELSGGMARRGAIARALAFKHTALILDEAFSGLDDKIKYSIINYIKTSEKGIVILVSHDMSECKALCDRIVYIGEE